LLEQSIAAFYRLRQIEGVEKRPATRELINWVRALQSDPDFQPRRLAKSEVPYLGVLFKKSQDHLRAREAVLRKR
jgi:hypothetical protein